MPTKYKLIIWHVLIVLLALVFWTYAAGVIAQPSDSFELGPESIVYLVVFASVIALGLALFRERWLVLSFTAVAGAPYLLVSPSYVTLGGLAFMVLFMFFSWSVTVSELRERSKVNIRAVLRRSLTAIILALFVAISFLAYGSPIATGMEKNERLPSNTEKFIGTVVRGTIGPRIEGSLQQKENIIAEVTRETFQEFNTFLKPYFRYAPPLLAFAVFFVLWGLSWFFVQLGVLLGMLIFWFLKKTNFVRIEERDAKAETLII
ncbi:MAG: hypothetical protein WD989_01440 [Candidatus Paceibacterota bacterium]